MVRLIESMDVKAWMACPKISFTNLSRIFAFKLPFFVYTAVASSRNKSAPLVHIFA